MSLAPLSSQTSLSDAAPQHVASVRLLPLSLKVNFTWVLAGRLVDAVSKAVILITVARLCTPELVGLYALGLAVTNPIILFTNLGLRAVQASDAKSEFPFATYLGLRLVTSTVAMAVVILAVVAADYPTEKVVVLLLIGLAKSVESMSDVTYGLFQKRERMDRIAQSLVIRGAVSVVAMVTGAYLTRHIQMGLVGMVAGWLLAYLGFDLPQARRLVARIRPDLHFSRLRQVAWMALPLGVVALLLALTESVPRLVIEARLGGAELGFFAAVAYMLIPGSIVANAIGQAALPRLSQCFAAGLGRAFYRLLLWLVGLAAGLGIISIGVARWLGSDILVLIYGTPYGVYGSLLTLMMLAGTFLYIASILGFAVTATRKFRLFVPTYSAWAGAAVLFSLWLIPTYGLWGAAWASLSIGIVGCVAPVTVLAMVQCAGFKVDA